MVVGTTRPREPSKVMNKYLVYIFVVFSFYKIGTIVTNIRNEEKRAVTKKIKNVKH